MASSAALTLRPELAARPLLAARSGAVRRPGALRVAAAVVEPGSTVLVAGATGGVGQLLTAKLLERGYKVRALSRSAEKVQQQFGGAEGLTTAIADLRDPSSLGAALGGVDAVCCCTGTTAFPSKRWDGGNNPEQTDYVSVSNLIKACPPSLKRFTLTTSAGVERSGQFPFAILNLFGVLKFKRMGEQVLESSGLPWVVIRPGRLTDGPYTSFDLNTLFQATSGSRQDVQLSLADDLSGEASRIAVAEAIVQSLLLDFVEGRHYALSSKEGDGPGKDPAKWRTLFAGVRQPAGVA
ncbi:nucleoside diphosphate sugar epimerase [Micractinium conductrix]|uniref:Nucleoside diphosphate sugar epimerase n=1 Tax=Micractinium conductrix TaxID=554055 RepID=A0A2P6VPY4_9CHLO|nr:nucleoside diphosphate sugar epimerase [Micractinium conductrix]|eukprot:PSC76139.1 nucleoside diphosphate sugar epimerase [Micractinium conductrix]